MELQGSNIFLGGSNREQYPPPIEQIQSGSNHQQMAGNSHSNTDYGNLGLGNVNSYNPSANGYQTEDIFAANSNPFLDTLRSLALNPSQINNLLSALPAVGGPLLQPVER